MQSIRRRLKQLSKTFPPPKDTGPERLSAAALTHLSEEELLLLLDINEKQESSPVLPLSEPETAALEAYYAAYELESRQARFL
jgi:hypothetical protein